LGGTTYIRKVPGKSVFGVERLPRPGHSGGKRRGKAGDDKKEKKKKKIEKNTAPKPRETHQLEEREEGREQWSVRVRNPSDGHDADREKEIESKIRRRNPF